MTVSGEVVDNLVEQKNLFTVVGGTLLIEALGDRVIILEDRFRTGYECKECDGEGHVDAPCSFCKGSGYEDETATILCRMCRPTMAGETSSGKQRCPTCNGRGALIVVPQDSERRPSSGIIQSCGPECKILKVGDRVMYSNFAGHAINFKQKTVMRIMKEHEVQAKLYGTENLGKIVK